MNPKIVLFMLALVVWGLFSWVPDVQHVLVGIVVAAMVGFLLGDLVVGRPYRLHHPKGYFYFLFQYVPVFLWEVLKANLDVAYRVVHPNVPIKPGIVKVKTSLRSDIACTLLANSITLTPGTMSVDIDKDNAVLYVHWIDVRSDDMTAATQIIVDRFERILRNMFEEEARHEDH